MRFDNTKFRSLNETITHLNEPQVAVDEYTELLESVLLALCDELELDPNELVEAVKKSEGTPKKKLPSQKKQTPTNKKKHDASYSEYIKSTNNRTDSKGKKLDPYDDYES